MRIMWSHDFVSDDLGLYHCPVRIMWSHDFIPDDLGLYHCPVRIMWSHDFISDDLGLYENAICIFLFAAPGTFSLPRQLLYNTPGN